MMLEEVATRYRGGLARRIGNVEEGGRYYVGKKVDETDKMKIIGTLPSIS